MRTNESCCYFTAEDFLKEEYFELPNIKVIISPATPKALEKVKKMTGGNYRIEDGNIIILSLKPEQKQRFGFADLVNIVKVLRSESGCPWDKAQTYDSLRANVLEESFEVIEAIEKKNMPLLQEELGDLILQPVFLTNIAESEGAFTFFDMFSAHCKKLIFRHSHIFGNDKAEDSANALKTWDKNKNIEKHLTTLQEELDAIPKTLPSLMYATKVLKKLKKYNHPLYEKVSQSGGSNVFEALLSVCKAAKDADIDLEIEFSKWLKNLDV